MAVESQLRSARRRYHGGQRAREEARGKAIEQKGEEQVCTLIMAEEQKQKREIKQKGGCDLTEEGFGKE